MVSLRRATDFDLSDNKRKKVSIACFFKKLIFVGPELFHVHLDALFKFSR